MHFSSVVRASGGREVETTASCSALRLLELIVSSCRQVAASCGVEVRDLIVNLEVPWISLDILGYLSFNFNQFHVYIYAQINSNRYTVVSLTFQFACLRHCLSVLSMCRRMLQKLSPCSPRPAKCTSATQASKTRHVNDTETTWMQSFG